MLLGTQTATLYSKQKNGSIGKESTLPKDFCFGADVETENRHFALDLKSPKTVEQRFIKFDAIEEEKTVESPMPAVKLQRVVKTEPILSKKQEPKSPEIQPLKLPQVDELVSVCLIKSKAKTDVEKSG